MPEENQKMENAVPVQEQTNNVCPAGKECKCKSNKTTMWLLAVLAVLGIGCAVYMYFFPMNCGTKGNNLADGTECKCEKCEECKECSKCAENEKECPTCEKCEEKENTTKESEQSEDETIIKVGDVQMAISGMGKMYLLNLANNTILKVVDDVDMGLSRFIACDSGTSESAVIVCTAEKQDGTIVKFVYDYQTNELRHS